MSIDTETQAAEIAAGGALPQEVLDFTEELFRIAVGDLGSILAEIRDGRFEAAKEGKRALRDLTSMSMQVLEERRNVEKFRKHIAGSLRGITELDLDAARDEIGRRLACLRAARGD